MSMYLIYNLSGELDDISHLFPNERLGKLAALIRAAGESVLILDRANYGGLIEIGAPYLENLGSLSFRESNASYHQGLERESDGILAENPDTVLLNLWQGTGFKFSLDLANVLKQKRPALKIYGIGQKVDWYRQHILSLAGHGMDGLITGLGYDAVEALVGGVDFPDCPNTLCAVDMGFREQSGEPVNADRFPVAAYEPEIYRGIEGKVPIYSMTLSNQACPSRCVFCVRPVNYGRAVIMRDPRNVLDELRALADRGISHVRLEDSTPPPGALTAFARAILDSDLRGRVRLSAFSRIDTGQKEDFQTLRAAGFIALFFGIESLDDDVLKQLNKGIHYEAVKQTLAAANAAGIHTIGSFIYPVPGETEESAKTTMGRLQECAGYLSSVLAGPAGIYPNTGWGNDPAKYGIILDEDYLEKAVTYPLKYLLPLKYWPPLPYSYGVMGKSACEVHISEIMGMYGQFLGFVRKQLQLPGIPDYYYLLADLVGRDPAQLTSELVGLMSARRYADIQTLLSTRP